MHLQSVLYTTRSYHMVHNMPNIQSRRWFLLSTLHEHILTALHVHAENETKWSLFQHSFISRSSFSSLQAITRMLISIVSRFICRCLSSLFKELWPFENRKMYRDVLKIHFSNGQYSLENVSISLKLSWQMLLWILWNSQKIDSRL